MDFHFTLISNLSALKEPLHTALHISYQIMYCLSVQLIKKKSVKSHTLIFFYNITSSQRLKAMVYYLMLRSIKVCTR